MAKSVPTTSASTSQLNTFLIATALLHTVMILSDYLHPTPQRSSAPCSPPYGLYRDGDEPDCSYTNNPSMKKQSSTFFIKDQGIFVPNYQNRRPNSRSQARILLADSPPTPPQKWSSPRTTSAPPTTTCKYLVSSCHNPSNSRPVINDKRPIQPTQCRVRFVVINSDCGSKHHRDYSGSSLDGRQSKDKVHRKRHRENNRREEAELHLRDRIPENNAKIYSRHVVPTELPLSAGRLVEAMITDSRAGLAGERRPLSLEEERSQNKARRPVRRGEKQEQKAQRERHDQCMQPRRHPTSHWIKDAASRDQNVPLGVRDTVVRSHNLVYCNLVEILL